MLIVAKTFAQMDFDKLMAVYRESNLENGKRIAPFDSMDRQIQMAEGSFFDYLRESFFDRKGAVYYILSHEKHYVCALRMEPYLDGFLIEALETVPSLRKQGYAGTLLSLVKESVSECGGAILYSHVSKKNLASQKVHERAGFQCIKEFASYIDGSISNQAYTYAVKVDTSFQGKM